MTNRKTAWWGLRIAALLAIAGQVACAEPEVTTEPVADDKGDLTLLITGDDISHTINGKAVFGTASGSNGHTEWVLFLWRGDMLYYTYQFDVLDLFRDDLYVPEPGTYDMAAHSEGEPSDEDFAGRYVFSFAISYGVFHVESGTLTIDASSDQEISGSFEMMALRDEANSSEVRADTAFVTGTFRAVPGVIPVLN